MTNFKELLQNATEKTIAKKDYYISEKKVISYGDFAERLKRICAFFKANNVAQGDKILISVSNDYDMICVTLGTIVYGATAVLIDPDTKNRRASVIISSSQINGWIVDKENVTQWDLPKRKVGLAIEEATEKKGMLIKKLLSKKKQEAPRQTLDSFIQSPDNQWEIPISSVDQAALIMFTSGTTSDPKGVVLTHGNLLSHLATLSKQYQLTSDSIISNVLPLYHVDGLIQGAFLTFYNQISLSRPFKFEVQKIEDILHSIYKYRVSHFFTVPTMLTLIDKFGTEWRDSFDTQDFRYIISSAGYLEEKCWETFMKNFNVKIVNVYGLTEVVAGSLFCGPSDHTWRIGSIGKPIDAEVKIVNPEGNSLPHDQVGELLIKGAHVMKAYLKPSGNPDENGWFHTGDLIYRDQDGFYYIKGRVKNVIIKGGVNVYPEEIIETLQMSPDVEEAYVFGESDETWGEKIIAVVIKKTTHHVNDSDIIQYYKEHLEQTNVPDEVYFLDDLPKGLSGKIQKDQIILKIQALKLIQKKGPDKNESIQNTLLNIASKCFNHQITKDQLSDSSQAIQGWNSLEHLHFATLIEKTFSIQLSTRDIMNITSIEKAAAMITNKLQSGK